MDFLIFLFLKKVFKSHITKQVFSFSLLEIPFLKLVLKHILKTKNKKCSKQF